MFCEHDVERESVKVIQSLVCVDEWRVCKAYDAKCRKVCYWRQEIFLPSGSKGKRLCSFCWCFMRGFDIEAASTIWKINNVEWQKRKVKELDYIVLFWINNIWNFLIPCIGIDNSLRASTPPTICSPQFIVKCPIQSNVATASQEIPLTGKLPPSSIAVREDLLIYIVQRFTDIQNTSYELLTTYVTGDKVVTQNLLYTSKS